MAWDFDTDPDYQQKLDWASEFVRTEVEPLDLVFRGASDPFDPARRGPAAAMAPLKAAVKARGMWACHLGPELGGPGYGQVKLGLLNEILGRSRFAPTVFGTQAPDTGNAEILARFGTAEQKRTYLTPLMNGDIASCYSMTEPQAGADPGEFKCRARLEGDHWIIDGEKWFASHADFARFILLVAITNPDVPVHKGASILIVDRNATGLEVVRNVAVGIREQIGSGVHGYLRFTNCRIPKENLLGSEGQGFEIAQSRLGGGRLHHAMRTVGLLRKALDMMCERALSRTTKGELLSEKQFTQEKIADSHIQITQFRLHVLYTAWLMDKNKAHDREVRREIAAVKASMPGVLRDVIYRALHLHGSLGMSNEMPLMEMWATVPEMGIVDGPTEVHKVALAKALLRDRKAAAGPWPSYFLPDLIAQAKVKLAHAIELDVGSL